MATASCLPPLRQQRTHHGVGYEATRNSGILHNCLQERQAGAMAYPTLHSTMKNTCDATGLRSTCNQQQPAQAISVAALIC